MKKFAIIYRNFKINIFISIILFSFILLFKPTFIFAQNTDIQTTIDMSYEMSLEGISHNIYKVELVNLVTEKHAPSFTLRLPGSHPQNIHAFQGNDALPVTVETQNNQSVVTVNFTNAVVGKGKSRQFRIEFDDSKYVVKTGEVWEVSLPSMQNTANLRVASVTLSAPQEWGQLAHIFPEPASTEENSSYKTFLFRGGDIENTGVVAAFGQFQVFEFNLFYHLENTLSKEAPVEIALPPDTAYQKVMYQSIDPKPKTVTVDADGNWIAKYILPAKHRVDIKAVGHVQIYNEPRVLPPPSDKNIRNNMVETTVWQTSNPFIQQKALELKTPKAIYDYVVESLSYDYTRVKPNADRLGAVGAISRPSEALCTEFTDLFIALARSAGIPAREVNGYVYTDNPELKPLSLVADVLHAWPEYWNSETHTWVAVDPTWANTTGGVDYFSKPDLRHFSFVIHGESSTEPYPAGSYKLGVEPQKDVFVSFSKLPSKREAILDLTISSNNLKIVNPGPAAVYNQSVSIAFDSIVNSEISLTSIPPFATINTPYKIPYGVVTNMPSYVSATVADQTVVYKTRKEEFIIVLLTIILCIIIVLLSFIIIKRNKTT